MLGPHGIRGIFLSAPGSVSELVEHPRTSQQFPNTSNIDKFRSKRNDNAKNRRMGLRKLHRNQSLDLPNQVETEYSDKNTHNRCANEKNEAFLSKLRELPDYLCEQLNKNNHWEFHQITEKDFAQPIFIDHSGYVIWILNEDDHCLKYLGKDLIEGLTNFFIYPDNICEVMEDTGERIPVEIWDNRIIVNINYYK
ncbi:hypothetical protein RhiirA4_404271 [Rhizophagus irregularis]|uniref:Uncharacterized protein n=1 Tax=Rhizophagus irregularis TaxID=588596 RepID=A0A2I1GP32_9GLOM|nr:hypothetical protein RhiirA4_404271 [Rhizophagus irregularis]